MDTTLNETLEMLHLKETAEVVASMIEEGTVVTGYCNGEVVYRLAHTDLKSLPPDGCAAERPPSDGWWNVPSKDTDEFCTQTNIDTAAELLDQFAFHGIALALDGDIIVVRCGEGPFKQQTPENVALVNQVIDTHRPGLVAILSPQCDRVPIIRVAE